jgi:D-galactose 1-dehydrogenase
VILLADGGARLIVDGKEVSSGVSLDDAEDGSNPLLGGEYTRLYAKFAALVKGRRIDMDLSPMIHVSDAFLLGRRVTVEPFVE